MSAQDVPVYLNGAELGFLADPVKGVHHTEITRAWERGYIQPAAYVGDRPLWSVAAVFGLKAYLKRPRQRSGFARRHKGAQGKSPPVV